MYKKRVAVMTMATILASSSLGLVSVFAEEPNKEGEVISSNNSLHND